MLNDADIVVLKKNRGYKEITKLGLKEFVHDLVKSGYGDLNPEINTLIKFIHSIVKARKIRGELYSVSQELIELILNYCMKPYNRTIEGVKYVCTNSVKKYYWMRYDVERVESLFNRCNNLLILPEFRQLIKNHSSILVNKDNRIMEIINELEILKQRVIRSIRSKGLFDDLFDWQKEEYYNAHKDEIADKFLKSGKGGFLGELPEHKQDDK